LYVYLWLIHVEVWQKTTKFCKAIILQEKEKKYPAQSKTQNKRTTTTTKTVECSTYIQWNITQP
ncbi:hypothetical protein K3W81_14740, partial [Listeria monocytogenes]|nr:hypothetical protein [Listeria monocytogenes]